ncbi:MAG: GMP synthase [Gammaproteobacteria bacterium]|nr:GMP synthase [Gammaproteobacteria bacterium]
MHVGILKCDTVRDEFLPRFGDYPGMFRTLLDGVDADLSYTVYDVCNDDYPPTTDACDAYLVTGSRWGVYDDQRWIPLLADYIRKLHSERRRMVGICFGHQLISLALGGHAEKSHKGWGVGVATVKVHEQPSWMNPVREEFSLVVSHQDQVTELPPGAQCIASSDFCAYAALTIDDNVLTFQGHPEFGHELSRTLMEWRQDVVGEKRTAAGMESLRTPVHDLDVARWMVTFLRR